MPVTKTVMEFKRGTGVTHYLSIPLSAYTVGSNLFFTAKPLIDNDVTDNAAVINKEFNDSNIVGPTDPNYVAGYATYQLTFDPIDIMGISFPAGITVLDYLGEFKFEAPAADPVTFPADNDYIDVKIYGNVRLET